jgi:hypothetical protein
VDGGVITQVFLYPPRSLMEWRRANGPREADVHSAKSRAGRRRKGILELVWQSEVVRLHVSDGSSHRRPAFAHERW